MTKTSISLYEGTTLMTPIQPGTLVSGQWKVTSATLESP